MSTLSTKIRKVIGKGKSSSGRGMRWMYVNGTKDGGRATVEENERVIQALIDNFETYLLKQTFRDDQVSEQFISFIYDKNGKYLGSCKISRWPLAATSERYILVDYTTASKESIKQSVRECSGFVSFEPVK